MKTVRQWLREQEGSTLFATTPQTTVYDALQTLAEVDHGALLVMEGESLIGLFTERDYARKVVLLGKASSSTFIREVMTARVPFVTPANTLEECMVVASELRARYLPILEDGVVLGMLSISDLVEEQIADQDFIIEQLEHYIHGWSRAI